MEEEFFISTVREVVDRLSIFIGPEGNSYKSLGFSSGKESRAVCSRDNAEFNADRSNLVKGSAVKTFCVIENHMAHDLLFDRMNLFFNNMGVQKECFTAVSRNILTADGCLEVIDD